MRVLEHLTIIYMVGRCSVRQYSVTSADYNLLDRIVELLTKGTLLFTTASETVPYRSGPPLLCSTVPRRTVLHSERFR